jgi:ubiquinone/menaquinone biosynthesis C-methylase UbiE
VKGSRKEKSMSANHRPAASLKSGINRALGTFGLRLGSLPRPTVAGNETISGSFPRYGDLHLVGRRENYFIQDGYQHRSEPIYFDDSGHSDAWQDEVYRFAREIAERHGLDSVIDIGCGSGDKLIKYFRDRMTIGLDVEATCAVLRRRHPNRRWSVCDFHAYQIPKGDLVIASDVIEHLAHPNEMLEFIQRIAPVYVIVSTPDRNLLRYGAHKGPPYCPAHMREWSMAELHAYLSEYFDIAEHFISYTPQGTQCVLARPRTPQSRAQSK